MLTRFLSSAVPRVGIKPTLPKELDCPMLLHLYNTIRFQTENVIYTGLDFNVYTAMFCKKPMFVAENIVTLTQYKLKITFLMKSESINTIDCEY